jgi:deazaflavin-dependent oxidoreductase (nitroreductase family)
MTVKQELSHGRPPTWLRQVHKASFSRLTLALAGRHVFAVVHHVGRRSGHAYTTPVIGWPIADGFIIPLPYGADTDWCRNVLAAGQGTIEWHGRTYPVSRPEVVGATTALPLLPTWARWPLRALRMRQFLKVDQLTIR